MVKNRMERKMEKENKNAENSGQHFSLPVVLLNGERMQRQQLVPKQEALSRMNQLIDMSTTWNNLT